MATVTGLTAERMLEIEAESIVDGSVDVGTGHLILTRHDGTTIDAGPITSTGLFVDLVSDQANVDGLKTFLKKASIKIAPNLTPALRIGTTTAGQADALNVTPYGAASVVLASGADYVNGVSTARATSAAQIEFINSAVVIYADAGVTVNSAYTRTKQLSINESGVLSLFNGGTLKTGQSGAGTTVGGVQIGGGINGYHGEVNFSQDLGNGTTHAVTSLASGNSSLTFDMRNTLTGTWKFRRGTGGTLADIVTIDANAKLTVFGNIEANTGYLRAVGLSGTPRLYFRSTDLGTDAKVWDIAPVGVNLELRCFNDAEAGSNTALRINRPAGYVPTSVEVLVDLKVDGKSGFYGTAPIAKPTVAGSRSANAALASLITQLSNLGLITDTTTV